MFLPGEFHGQRSPVGYSPWGHKESDMAERLTHSHTMSNIRDNSSYSPITLVQLKAKIWRTHILKEIKKYSLLSLLGKDTHISQISNSATQKRITLQ